MPLSPEDRAAFLDLLPQLGPGGDRREVVRFVADRRPAALEELGAQPGFDQVRAGMIRLLPDLVPDAAERGTLLSSAAEAVAGFQAAAGDADPTLFLARHPAWVGLCVLELAEQGGWSVADATERAAELAGRGFARLSREVGEGEVLWAMAEQAEEVGWTERARTLLEAAADAAFADPSRRAETRLVLALRRVEDGDRGAAAALATLAADEALDPRTRNHARWVLARLALDVGDAERALGLLRAARSEVDPSEEPEVAERLDQAIRDLE